ncbi:BZ3500_MvSof-1268-A1-R1_Chr5-2g07892 [Microbotryum saponariae]|uniref:BZ3500_MvSof-1268-A1-R1_Chr5-2g07892 protein n=1 Tax=Microbotryum saponariae TaxID=289078 RepID=A0A2X0LFR1_9BASI|nr:BZ3500_MvSof-1268-A1-R1_Chr5-2g07892 [Microbotryum saponariae]SDA05761.1 BZ3501_MvSof-1269-A2-R1_Chr5-2g07714 [Microbotryum saponariae]
MATSSHNSPPLSSASSDTVVEDLRKPTRRGRRSFSTSATSSSWNASRQAVLNVLHLISPWTWFNAFLNLFYALCNVGYQIYQAGVDLLFTAPYRPLPDGVEPFGRVAIIGAGLSGISSAAHIVAHGFDVVIYEADDKIGGIWANVNSTSSLQLNSLLYRFHPSIRWSCGFPQQPEIVSKIQTVFERYHLGSRTRLSTRVTKIVRDEGSSTDPNKGGHARWIVNDGEDGVFDAVIATVGTCGTPKWIDFPHKDKFKGRLLHSSQLDSIGDLKSKKVVVLGSGASGVEAAELAVSKQASEVVVLARTDKWVIPRSTVFDVLLSLQPFGREMVSCADAPGQPVSEEERYFRRVSPVLRRTLTSTSSMLKRLIAHSTPIVNNDFLDHIREGKIAYKRGDTQEFTAQGVRFSERERDQDIGEEGIDTVVTADIVVFATGYERPSIDFLPKDLFPVEGARDYQPPNLYIQMFSTEDCSVLLTNAAYLDAIGTVGSFHIGVFARVLMLFLLDKRTRPLPKSMKTWIDVINWIKRTAFGEHGTSGLAFFTYAELLIWLVVFHFFKLARLAWMPFVLFGWGVKPTMSRKYVHT